MGKSTIKNNTTIIESGNTRTGDINWHYRKWSDGTAECWGYWASNSFAPGAAVGGFYGRVISGFYWPSNLFIGTPCGFFNLMLWGTGYFWGQLRTTDKDGFQLAVWRNDNAASPGYGHIYAIGNWKEY